ncbi:p-loop containing nucleoside triphosphate hydrolase protein [Mycena kentingensis (nom. inval.)]|nr:p-loop containing nucleoside triphosphate hydrolase protein [Mycena kentingensis (nom. inval.)]
MPGMLSGMTKRRSRLSLGCHSTTTTTTTIAKSSLCHAMIPTRRLYLPEGFSTLLMDILSVFPLILPAISVILLWKGANQELSSRPRSYHVLRLAACIFLWSLAAIRLARTSQDTLQLAQFVYHCYAVVLAGSLCRSPRNNVARHLTILLGLFCAAYVAVDVWTMAAPSGIPPGEGLRLGLEICILSFIGILHPLITPRTAKATNAPEERASTLSLLTYAFLDPLIWTARRTSRVELPPLSEKNAAWHLTATNLSILEWHADSLLRGLTRVFRIGAFWQCPDSSEYLLAQEITTLCILYLLQTILTLATPVGLKQLLSSLDQQASIKPWFWILWILLASILRTLATERYMFIATRTMIQMEAILQQLVVKHSLRIRTNFESSGSGNKGSLGQLMNLTSDLANISAVVDSWLVIVVAPLQIALCTWFLYEILGWSALVGLAVMIMCLPVPAYLTVWVMREVQVARMKSTDERLQSVTETLSILRMVKMFGWETRMTSRMSEKRRVELQIIRKEKLLSLLIGNFKFVVPILSLVHGTLCSRSFVIPFLTMIAAYATYTLLMKQALTAAIVFSSMAVFELLRLQLRSVLTAVPVVIKGRVSLDRLSRFLTETELFDSETFDFPSSLPDDVVAGIRNTIFSWNAENTLKINNEIIFRPGVVNVITGPTGAGKSSMLLALLGEMKSTRLSTTQPSWFGLDRSAGVAYAPQESWLQNSTIKENIVLGSDVAFDEVRYAKVLEQCGLVADLLQFDHGDQTLVGERGVSLSGGQKARITLARCVYSAAQIVLLDDPLAALDVRTATSIVDKCLAGDLMQGRTVLLVTHNVALASRVARSIVRIGADGTATQEEVVENLKLANPPESAVPSIYTTQLPAQADAGSLAKEEAAEGHVSWSAFRLYHANLNKYPWVFWLLFAGGIVLNEATLVLQAWWLGFWSQQYETHDPADVKPSYYLGGYGFLLAISMIFFSGYFTTFTFGTMRASLHVHNRLMASVVGCTLRWLDATPTSRIMARAVQDMRIVDDSIGLGGYRVIQLSLGLLIKFCTIVAFSPAFLVPGVAITVLGAFCGQLFMKAQLPVKREMSNARAPILGHFSAVIGGLSSIRAFGLQELFLQESLLRIDVYSRAAITYHNLNRWISVRSDFLGGLFTSLLATYLIYIRRQDAPTTGFVLNNAFGYSIMVLLWVRYFNTVELDGNSLERILEFVNIEQQKNPEEAVVPQPAYWPASGSIIARDLTAKYSVNGVEVLRQISFEIKSGERVAVVGRTGSGKSSLILALLRCILTEGTVLYDGIDTKTLDLDVLRSNITIVPQVPDLLCGTLRHNLDPFSEYDDAVLNNALRSAGLSALQDENSETQLSLDTEISGGGGNISFGERQIIALARAIIRESKLLILDEATSGIDYGTDAIIQNTLRNELKDVSVLTIAHRLKTIMDSDKIMVLDAGRIVEFDAPKTLLQNQDGYLRGLVEQSMDRDALLAIV